MNEQEFWQIIDRTIIGKQRNTQLSLLSKELGCLSHDEYQSFVNHFHNVTIGLINNDAIVNAAYLANEQCLSLDVLDYFCWWLVSMGQSSLREIVADPDVIADFLKLNIDPNYEEFGAAVYSRKNTPTIFGVVAKTPRITGRIWSQHVLEKKLPRLYAYSK